MRSVTFALVLALGAGSFATTVSAAPTAPATTPTTKPAPKLTPQQRALRACAKMKDEQAKASCQRRAHAQVKKAPRKATKRPPPPAPAPASDAQN